MRHAHLVIIRVVPLMLELQLHSKPSISIFQKKTYQCLNAARPILFFLNGKRRVYLHFY
jgi:hypothetical protein